MLDNIKAGINEIAFHVAYDNEEMQKVAIDHPDFGSAWRQRDLDFVASDVFHQAIHSKNIKLITWRQIKNCLY